jgi:hypothetical protein
MRTSEQIHELVAALAKARAAFEPITRTKTVQVKSDRGAYTFAYAPLEDILSAVTAALSAQGLVLIGGTDYAPDGSLLVISRLCYSSGQWLECAVNVGRYTDERGKVQLQPTGSAMSYGRRYSISALLALAADDDGASASGDVITGQTTKPAAPTNGHDPNPERPTEAHIAALRTLALQECGADVEAFEHRIRRIMGLKPGTSVAPKLLTRTMTMVQDMAVFEHYTRLAAQLARPTPEASADESQAPTTAATEPAPAQEPPAAVPSRAGFSSTTAGKAPEVASSEHWLIPGGQSQTPWE